MSWPLSHHTPLPVWWAGTPILARRPYMVFPNTSPSNSKGREHQEYIVSSRGITCGTGWLYFAVTVEVMERGIRSPALFPSHSFRPGNGVLSAVFLSSLLCLTFCSTLHHLLTVTRDDQPSDLCGTEGCSHEAGHSPWKLGWVGRPTVSQHFDTPPRSEWRNKQQVLCLWLRSSLLCPIQPALISKVERW